MDECVFFNGTTSVCRGSCVETLLGITTAAMIDSFRRLTTTLLLLLLPSSAVTLTITPTTSPAGIPSPLKFQENFQIHSNSSRQLAAEYIGDVTTFAGDSYIGSANGIGTVSQFKNPYLPGWNVCLDC